MSDDEGATAVEYALVVTFIAVAITASVTAFGIGVQSLFAMMPAGL